MGKKRFLRFICWLLWGLFERLESFVTLSLDLTVDPAAEGSDCVETSGLVSRAVAGCRGIVRRGRYYVCRYIYIYSTASLRGHHILFSLLPPTTIVLLDRVSYIPLLHPPSLLPIHRLSSRCNHPSHGRTALRPLLRHATHCQSIPLSSIHPAQRRRWAQHKAFCTRQPAS